MAPDSKELSLHLRLIHFSLVVTSAALIVAMSQELPGELERAKRDIVRLQAVAARWSAPALKAHVTELSGVKRSDRADDIMLVLPGKRPALYSTTVPHEPVFSRELRGRFKDLRQPDEDTPFGNELLFSDGRLEIISLADVKRIWDLFDASRQPVALIPTDVSATFTSRESEEGSATRKSTGRIERRALRGLGLWEVSTRGQVIDLLEDPTRRQGDGILNAGRLQTVASLSNERIAIGGGGPQVHIVDPRSAQAATVLKAEHRIRDIAASRDGRVLIGIPPAVPHVLIVWDVERGTGEEVTLPAPARTIDGESERPGTEREDDAGPFDRLVAAVAISDDGKVAMRASHSRVSVWHVADKRGRTWARPRAARWSSVALAPARQWMAAGLPGGQISIIDLERNSEVARLSHDGVAVTALAFSGDGEMLVTGGSDGTVRMYRRGADGKWTAPTKGESKHESRVTTLTITRRDSQHLAASGGLDFQVRVWNLDGLREIQTMSMDGMPRRLSFTPDGRRLAAATIPARARELPKTFLVTREPSTQEFQAGVMSATLRATDGEGATFDIPIQTRIVPFDIRKLFADFSRKHDPSTLWPRERFDKTFRSLDALTRNVQTSSLYDIQMHLEDLEKREGGQIEAFGLKIHGETLARYGLVVLLAVQTYFWLHLRTFRRRAKDQDFEPTAAWVLIYDDWWARRASEASVILLPATAALAVTMAAAPPGEFWEIVRHTLKPSWAYVAVVLALATAYEVVQLRIVQRNPIRHDPGPDVA
jgi:hypothetical protein